MDYYTQALKKYAVFTGRARRKEYWMFFLFNFLISFVLGAIDGAVFGHRAISTVYSLAVLVPSIAVGVRRMHDVNKSGWFILIPIYNLILAVTEGTPDTNEYGPNPKGESTAFTTNPETEVY